MCLMKKYKALALLITAAAVLFTFTTTSEARRYQVDPQGGGRLVIWRSPDMGRNVVIGVLVDGRHVADLTYGRNYDQPISPGRHVVAVQAFPRVYAHAAYSIAINVRPGELYNYTAKGGATQLVLK